MREFVAACLVCGVITAGAAAVLDRFLQEPMSVAFAGTKRTNLRSPAVSAEHSR